VAETLTEPNAGPLAGYAEEPNVLGSYSAIIAIFNAPAEASLVPARRSGGLPERLGADDVVLPGVATHKPSRLIAKDTVTSPLRTIKPLT
jgi:hypothetical protein